MKKFLLVLLCIVLAFAVIFGGFALANKLHEKTMNEYIDSFGKVEFENQLAPDKDENGRYYFTTDEDFKVLHLTDIHIGGGVLSAETDKKVINAVAAMITAEKPDLVIVTGDISFAVPWAGTINNSYAHNYFCRLMENLGVYWTVTLGNHDSESYDYYQRSWVADRYASENLEYCLFERGPEDVAGEGNHVINVKGTTGLITQSFIMMDTHSYTDEDPLGIMWLYDNIDETQIDWYKGVIAENQAQNRAILASMNERDLPENADLENPKSMLFMHIPLMEVRNAYLEYLGAGENDTDDSKYIEGKVGETDPYVYCSEEEEQMFETILELGSTKAMFYGHDHLNNLVVEYKGVVLSYGYSMDYFAYSGIDKIGSQRGCTVIICSPDTSFEIIHENYYQDKYQPLYPKETVDMTN